MRKNINAESLTNFRQKSKQYSDATMLLHEAIARKAGLTGTDHKYLGMLIDRGGVTAGELSKMTGLTKGAVTGLIDRLEEKNLVRRQFDKSDRRKIIIVPDTANAMKLLAPVFSDLQVKTSALLSSFSENEIEIVERYFTSAIGIMNEVTSSLNNQNRDEDE